ncbi:MAG: efflux RND transporter permease subunit, partial [Flavobacteriales bacterium]
NGVPGMRYMTSDATSAGEAVVRVVFEPGTDPGQAVVLVKNRVSQVKNRLPPLVRREGIIVNRIQPSMLMYVNLYSTDTAADMKYMKNFGSINITPQLNRIDGVGRAEILGSRQYAMRVWLKPDRMRAYNVSTEEVMKALEEQSMIGSPGRIGRSTGGTSQSLEYVLKYKGRYSDKEEYENIIIRANPEGEVLRLKDIAKVELGSEFYDIYSNYNGHPSAAIKLHQLYGSNASKVIKKVKKKLEEIKANKFPPGMKYEITYDVSKFLNASFNKVLKTLGEAFVLVTLVVFLFLGDWRSTLIPMSAVPVSMVGAFFVMQAFGLSINLITLFALVLSIGIVVDNAIVVVEAVHAKMEEKDLSPYKATMEVVNEIGGAIIAITMIMAAVFIPIAFMSGSVGVFYRQFSITMASSIILSGLIALTLTPILCAIILKKPTGENQKSSPLKKFFDWFNRGFQKLTGKYTNLLNKIVNKRSVILSILLVLCGGIYILNNNLPKGFIPNEDQGMIYAVVQTKPGTTLPRTNAKVEELQDICLKMKSVKSVAALSGFEILTEGRGSNAGTCVINLKNWSNRAQNVDDVIKKLKEKTGKISGAKLEFFKPPTVPGFGTGGGFALRLLDKTNTRNYKAFSKVNEKFMNALREREELKHLFTFFANNYPQYKLVIDNKAAMQKGVSIEKAMDNLSILIGSTYEQGFIKFGRFYKLYVQSAPEYRKLPKDIMDLYVKNEDGEQVPYSSFMTMEKDMGPNEITRYNMYPSSAIRGVPAKGNSSSEAINAIREVAENTLPKGYDIDWGGLTKDQVLRKDNEALYIFIIVIVFVYLVLAAQYENFMLPLAVILSLIPGILGAFLLLKMMGLANDIYAQLGLIMLVGLLGKNAVLIVEFAVQEYQRGTSVLNAAIEGGRIRFRAILMTSFAFIGGLIPLTLTSGVGAKGMQTIGSSALGGMIIGTLIGVIVAPGLYYIFGKLSEGRKLIRDEDEEPLTEAYMHKKSESKFRRRLKNILKALKIKKRSGPNNKKDNNEKE